MEQVYKKTGFLFKLLPCLLATIIAFMTLYGSFVYASTDIPVVVGNNINDTITFGDWSDEYKIYFIYTENNSHNGINYSILISDKDLELRLPHSTNNNSDYIMAVANDYSASIYVVGGDSYFYSSNESLSTKISRDFGNSYNLPSGFTFTSYSYLSYFGTGITDFNNFIFDGTGSIYDVNSNLLFQVPTQEVGIIAEQTQGVQMDKILQEILGILPTVLAVIVGVIAIRKAILFLMGTLKKS